MNDDRALVSTRCITDTAAVPIALQHRFAQAAEILFILSLEGVAGRAKTMRKNLGIPAGAQHRPLECFLHAISSP